MDIAIYQKKRAQRMMLTELKGRMNELNKKYKKRQKYFKETNQSRRIHLKKNEKYTKGNQQ